MKIEIIIPDNKLAEVQESFSLALNGETDIKQWLKRDLINIYKTGVIIKARETTKPIFDEDIIEVK